MQQINGEFGNISFMISIHKIICILLHQVTKQCRYGQN
uniref:Uncharacterized protein n=1 Tax=Arundo donax TaxID=35708 RepID=A0A0A9AGH3_ARUDO